MSRTLILGAKLVNEGHVQELDLLIDGERISRIDADLQSLDAHRVIEAKGQYLLPGLIDDQVHFREPGLTHKADLESESRAAVAGGITSYMEMPNTKPPALTHDLLEWKYSRAAQVSRANYTFFLGASNDNLEAIQRTDYRKVCGVKIFMGSSTGNLLVDEPEALHRIFAEAPTLIATHCEDEATIRANLADALSTYGEKIPIEQHPLIRSREACLKSSSFAVELAKAHDARLHILHISTAQETQLFQPGPIESKRITAEACVHHLWFSEEDYERKGSLIKWNPAVKSASDREAIWNALIADRIDVLATDHAPHTKEEKANPSYTACPSGGPLVQHALVALMESGKLPLQRIVEKNCHNPAKLFGIVDRGFLREGYYADLVLVDPDKPWKVSPQNIASKCGWSPFEGQEFQAAITHTFINGDLAYQLGDQGGKWNEQTRGKRLLFDRGR